MMTRLQQAVEYCNTLTRTSEFKDFPGAENGLQLENSGKVTKIGAAVDAGLEPFRRAIAEEVDFLIVHHGMFWTPPVPLTGSHYAKVATAIRGDLAVYGCHLPLDAHPSIGNNALLAAELGLTTDRTFLNYESNDIGILCKFDQSRRVLADKLRARFPHTYTEMLFGSEQPETIAILTGSGASAVDHLRSHGADTLITGELKQHHFNQAQELGLNLFPCGHYATEVFGVQALAQKLAAELATDWTFIDTACPL